MAKLKEQLAALLGKERAGKLSTAEVEELAAIRAQLAQTDDEDADGEDDEESAEGDDEDEEASTAESGDDEDDAESDDEDKASALADKVLNSKEAKGRERLAARLATRVGLGKQSVRSALADLAASPRGSSLDQRMAADRTGAKPDQASAGAVDPLVADAMSRNPEFKR